MECTRMKALPLAPIVVAALAVASAAHAQVVSPAPDIRTAYLAQAPLQSKLADKALDLSSRHAAFDVTYAGAGPARIPGVARTSVDRKLASDDLMGSLGFLCGLEPGAGKQGAAAARGYDPTGRFVGAKLRLAFR